MRQAFFVALVIPFTLALTALGIYFANINEMPGNPETVLISIFILASIGALPLFLVQLPFLGRKVFPGIAVTLLTLGFILWFQANVFNWNLGLMDGGEIPWKKYRPLGVFELVVYGTIFFMAFRFRNKLLEYLLPISCGLIFIQAVPVSLALIKVWTSETSFHAEQTGESPEHDIFAPTWKQYSFTFDGLFEFSQEGNVVLIVLDGLGKKIFDDIQKERPEEIGEIFRDFTCFTNVMCDRPATICNVPQILTGCLSEELPDFVNTVFQRKVFNRNDALLKSLAENQYRCDIFSWGPTTVYYDSRWIANIRLDSQDNYQENIPGGHRLVEAGIPELTVLTLFRSAPILLKRKTFKNNALEENLHSMLGDYVLEDENIENSIYRPLRSRMRDYEVNTFVQAASRTSYADRKTFKFIHLQGAHYPHLMNENYEKTELFGIESEKRQGLGSLRVTRNILDLMKESGVYDQSFIVIMSDHGPVWKSVETLLNHSTTKRPSFLIKRKHSQQSEPTYNDNPIHICDTTPIILSELGILQENDAFSPFEMPESLAKERNSQWKAIWNEAVAAMKEREWLELIALRPSQPLPDGRLISSQEIQREDISIQDSVLQVDIRGDCVGSVKFDKTWKTTIALSPLENPENRMFVSERPSAIVPFNTGGKVESWVCFQKLNVDTLTDGLYRMDAFFLKSGASTAQFKSSKVLSVSACEGGEKILTIKPPEERKHSDR